MKPEGGTAPHSHTHIEQINTQSIGSSDTIALTYVQYTSDHFKRFPKHTLTIAEQNVVFLVDSGATHSVIRALELTTKPRLSGKHVYSVGSSGQTIRENITVPLKCEDGPHTNFKHAFLLSEVCPINLMGRDLMCKLGLCLISTSEGVKVHRLSDLEPSLSHSFVHQNSNLLYAYQWQLQKLTVSSGLVTEAKKTVLTTATDFMTPEDLHCTSHVSPEPDEPFEESWLRERFDKLKLSHIYWTQHRCAISISLTSAQSNMYTITDSVPHITLAKHTSDNWEDLGPFIKSCQRAADWQKTCDRSIFFSPTLQCYCKGLTSVVHTTKTIQLVPESTSKSFSFLSEEQAAAITALQEVPKTMWAVNKYDVGLIKNCEPVVITPKSDFRPCKTQYPLKQEAIDGITPVFESLKAAGVIIPCDDSPVRTPLFPVKKIRDKNQPTEWRFVQDLQAVNAAVQPRAPNVPNPYTILSQVPPTAKFFSVVDLSNAFFSVPVHPESQFWFAFNFNGRGYTFTRLCQGYCESPTIYNEALKQSLESLVLSPDNALLQYVDDLMICSPTKEQCEANTVKLLKHLAKSGHKASLSKLQFVQEQVVFLGHVITSEGKTLSPNRVDAIQNLPKNLHKKKNDVISWNVLLLSTVHFKLCHS